MENFEKVYDKFLYKEIIKYCNKNKSYELNWDYRDVIEPSTMLEAYKNYKNNGYSKIINYLEDFILELNLDEEQEFLKLIKLD